MLVESCVGYLDPFSKSCPAREGDPGILPLLLRLDLQVSVGKPHLRCLGPLPR